MQILILIVSYCKQHHHLYGVFLCKCLAEYLGELRTYTVIISYGQKPESYDQIFAVNKLISLVKVNNLVHHSWKTT